MKKTVLWILVVVAFAAVAWRAWVRNHPEGSQHPLREARHSFRGHAPQDRAAENLSAAPEKGDYPPRALGLSSQRKPPSDSWLLDADSDRDRFRRLEVVLGSSDMTMLEIGMRFKALHRALASGDFPLAGYQMKGIVRAADVGRLMRPGFKEGQGLEYLGKSEWESLTQAVGRGDLPASKSAFLAVRSACMACHADKKMEFLNREEVFQSTEGFPAVGEAGAGAPGGSATPSGGADPAGERR